MDLTQVRAFGNLELLARQVVEGFISGLHKSPYHGFSVEFAEHRLYNEGESIRHIDWKVYARTDKLFVKRYEEETNLRAQIVVDASPSMYYPAPDFGKIGFSVAAAAALSYLLYKQRDAVGLTTFSDKIELQTPIKSTAAHLNQVLLALDALSKSDPKTEKMEKRTAAAQVLDHLAQRLHRRSLVVIFSDMLDNTTDEKAIFEALQHLKHQKHEVLLFHIKDKKTEEAFAFEDRPHEFIDLETNQRLKLQPAAVREFYQKQVKERHQRLADACGRYKIDFIEVDIAENLNQILLSYLIKRSRMK
ncbi:DUF58 domain-containing protein [Hugenholtzia roseola]|uniref:DUF58 domain-containing protein n=1 Tax=Hugenholtzia roseola TaxID=1002 RepID=UPI0005534889|nr:DUF58 domain-containing protein [Hugenholtzia roseola]